MGEKPIDTASETEDSSICGYKGMTSATDVPCRCWSERQGLALFGGYRSPLKRRRRDGGPGG